MKKIYKCITIFFFILSTFTLYHYIFVKGDYYQEIYQDKTNVYVKSLSTPRGRILDTNGKVLVDNVGVKTIIS